MAERGLTELQIEVLSIFFDMPESEGFVLAGGAALVASGLSTRPTEDVDLFSAASSIERAGDALEAALADRGWRLERMQASDTFRRLHLRTDVGDELLIDLARDSGPLGEVATTPVGPTYPAVELAARKVLALFGRAALRDFVDVAHLCEQFDRDDLLRLASEIDPGFDRAVFRVMLESVDRFTDDEIRPSDPDELRSFFRGWASDLVDEA